jgi:hypothetical protein
MPHPYAARAYAEALAGPEAVIEVPEWRGALLRRPIDAGGFDAGGVYPMTVIPKDADLPGGLARLQDQDLVSAVLVPDPLLAPPIESLERTFDVCRPFKTHFLIDRERSDFAPTKHHRDRIRRGLRRCVVERSSLAEHLEAWLTLYAGLVERREIGGAADFAPDYFDYLAGLPELAAFVAHAGGEVVGMTLWFAAEGVVYNHLTAVSRAGYAAGASYALYDAAIAHFSDGVINLGGGAGTGDGAGGLADFKRGFANAEVQSLVCGVVLDAGAYAALVEGRADSDFFPAYRAPA